ncbi:Uncharacterized conserved protein YdiU, UPF0061 family [Limimonas halophila]|uniref:Protein nucleotidyltransferase YdiU n=1 Tax=Limimonas halophila TaxID=1082479 RepID=A0A1G7USU7_9PROT|nr:YdiU family protein [Limimonas halophila]SDG50189.1 Uncharacterized conserved protein YdiU, UPF0061 family [Limimonas halophila]
MALSTRPENAAADPFGFDATYAALPERFYANVQPTPVERPRLLHLNRPLAAQLGLDPEALASPAGVEVLAGNRVPESARPIAMAYAGHQFGNWVPQLGDGRAVLLGELVDRDGVRRDVQLKGSGRTPFSRMGDGRAELFPVVGEYLASEGMAGLGIPTTRALAMVLTGETVRRSDFLPGAVLTRVATSHVRVGTFEYFARAGDQDAVRTLADYVIDRHYPELRAAEKPYRALLEAVARRTAELIANWMAVGFIHGVLNTDNISVVGETLDFGPFAWMDDYHPAQCFSQVDLGGRYAYNQQPDIGQWNLCRLAETLLPLLADDPETAEAEAYAALDAYIPAFEAAYHPALRRKLGLASVQDGDVELIRGLFTRMADQGADFTLTFRRLADVSGTDASADGPVRTLFADPAAFDAWAEQWRQRLAAEGRDETQRRAQMRAVNPAYVLRKHHVYAVYDAVRAGDHGALNELLTVLRAPFDDHPDHAAWAMPPTAEERVPMTFCGT